MYGPAAWVHARWRTGPPNEAYAPVWLSHCRKREEPGYPYRNDIIQMDWEEKSGVWVDREKVSFTLMLPPTKELMEKQYAEEKGRLK